jgi:hypothetical protein
MKRKKNVLLNSQSYKLGRWAEDHFDEIRHMGHGEIARSASAKLGFTVTVGNVCGLEDTLGVKFNPKAPPRAPLAELVAILAKDSIELRTKLGEPVSDDLKALAGVLL